MKISKFAKSFLFFFSISITTFAQRYGRTSDLMSDEEISSSISIPSILAKLIVGFIIIYFALATAEPVKDDGLNDSRDDDY